jgi:hypothetical protein
MRYVWGRNPSTLSFLGLDYTADTPGALSSERDTLVAETTL